MLFFWQASHSDNQRSNVTQSANEHLKPNDNTDLDEDTEDMENKHMDTSGSSKSKNRNFDVNAKSIPRKKSKVGYHILEVFSF